MRHLTVLICIAAVLAIAEIIGAVREGSSRDEEPKAADVPHIGSIQVVNGCGTKGAGERVADFLRAKNFDVKSISNAETWNYPFTMVVARTVDMTIASEVAKVLKTEKMVLVRNNEQLYDATVVIGPDYEERTR